MTTGERVAFGRGDGVPVAAAVAASRAVPGVRPPITLLGRRYMDGAIGSATNADLAAGADRVVVVTPTPAEPPDGTLFAVWDVALRRELEGLRAGGAEVVAIRAGAEDLEAMGPDLMSGERAAAAFAAGRLRGVCFNRASHAEDEDPFRRQEALPQDRQGQAPRAALVHEPQPRQEERQAQAPARPAGGGRGARPEARRELLHK